jgi:uncharacterized protein (TIGR04255 family)
VAWRLPEHDVKPFTRNTLAAVIVQLRFHPILKIADLLPAFQDQLRERFPGYEQVDSQQFEFNPASGMRMTNETEHRFRAENEPVVVSLTRFAISIEYSAHRDRRVLLQDVATLSKALAIYAPVRPVRLGLRYVNIIERESLGRDLRRTLTWSDLLTPAFAAVPAGIADLDEGTAFLSEISAPCSRGMMTLRYGVLRDPLRKVAQFRLDTDRYIEGGFTIEEVGALLDGFSSDIFQVFMTAAGESLLHWMRASGEAG